MRRLMALLLVAACGGTAATTTEPITTTTQATTSTSTTMATTTTVDPCPLAIEEGLATFSIVLDRMDANPANAAENTDDLAAVVKELADALVDACPGDARQEAFSELLVYFSEQSDERTLFTSTVLESLIDGLCEEPPVPLTLRGRAVCA